MIVDFNCDLGEGHGDDHELLELVTSANICCGAHAGNSAVSMQTLKWAAERNVRIGAHPGYRDPDHFGRRELSLPDDQLFGECVQQVGDLIRMAQSYDAEIRYVKPHGALYNQACREKAIANVIVSVAIQHGLQVMGLPNSELEQACRNRVEFVREGFGDRRYGSDGSLVPRGQTRALIDDAVVSSNQIIDLIQRHNVQSICFHGDHAGSADLIRNVRNLLQDRGVLISAPA